MKVVDHRVRSVDTIQSIAAMYLSNAGRWRDIVDFNKLDYPYVTADPAFEPNVKASGVLYVTRNYASSALTIPIGTQFAVPGTDNLPPRVYESLSATTFLPGVSAVNISVQCTVAGLWGNVSSNTIMAVVPSGNLIPSTFTSITNTAPFTNGCIQNVKTLGDSLLIPVDASWSGADTYSSLTDFYNRFFGEDLEIGADGDLTFDGYGSLGSVIGTANLAQSARDRLITPKLSLVYHPEYGSILGQITAQGITPYTEKWIALAIMETLRADDRIGRVQVVSLTLVKQELRVVVDITPINRGEPIRIPATLSNLPIAA